MFVNICENIETVSSFILVFVSHISSCYSILKFCPHKNSYMCSRAVTIWDQLLSRSDLYSGATVLQSKLRVSVAVAVLRFFVWGLTGGRFCLRAKWGFFVTIIWYESQVNVLQCCLFSMNNTNVTSHICAVNINISN